ncbi:Uncharacterised protein [uncultured archaeon]|nr:Uncharacterised protein [uncultured archaeon]
MHDNACVETARAQAGVEFLLVFSLFLAFFAIVVLLYSQQSGQVSSLSDHLSATRVCLGLSSSLSSFAAREGAGTYSISLPASINNRNYTVWVNSAQSRIVVDYGAAAVGCRFAAMTFVNSTNNTLFPLANGAVITKSNGVLTRVP